MWYTIQWRKKNGIFKFADKLVKLDKNIPSDITQTQNYKYSMDSVMSGYQALSK